MWVHSIFESISGEAGGIPQGTWCTFIRLQGCNLNCTWCDSPDARAKESAKMMFIPLLHDILDILEKMGNLNILITGGEPLLQGETQGLIYLLIKKGYQVQVETNGSYRIPYAVVPTYLRHLLHWVVDYKCPSSCMQKRMEAFKFIIPGNSIVKFVIEDTTDLLFAIDRIEELGLKNYTLSPLHGHGENIPKYVDILKKRNPDVLNNSFFSVQIHKLVNLP